MPLGFGGRCPLLIQGLQSQLNQQLSSPPNQMPKNIFLFPDVFTDKKMGNGSGHTPQSAGETAVV